MNELAHPAGLLPVQLLEWWPQGKSLKRRLHHHFHSISSCATCYIRLPFLIFLNSNNSTRRAAAAELQF